MTEKKQIVVVLGVVRDDEGRILLAERVSKAIPEANGRWEFPGGKLDFGEDPEVAVVREVKEETGLDVVVSHLVPKASTHLWDDVSGKNVHVVLLTYECIKVGGELSSEGARDEIGELKFVDLEEAATLKALFNVTETIKFL